MAHDAVEKVGALIVMALPVPRYFDKAKDDIKVKASRAVEESGHAFSGNVCSSVKGRMGMPGTHVPDTSSERF